MWDLPGPEIKPMSPALEGEFLTIRPPGKSSCIPMRLHRTPDRASWLACLWLVLLHCVCFPYGHQGDLPKPASHPFIVVQSLSRVWSFAIPWTAACQASLSFPISQSLLKPMSIELVMPSNLFILCHPLLLLPSIFSRTRVFFNKLALRLRWLKY